jgi:hypothetical protein
MRDPRSIGFARSSERITLTDEVVLEHAPATSLETILDVCVMPSLDALRIVRELVRRRIVVLVVGTSAKAVKK